MTEALPAIHTHVFLGQEHEHAEQRTWAVIWLCGAMMLFEIVGGILFGSIALVADGLHMSTHAGALLLAALAYTFARKHATDPRFSFGTGKLGDLAGFTSAVILALIALLIGYESVARFIAPVAIHFREAIPIACLGLAVNVASAWLLSGGGAHHHAHGHGHGPSPEGSAHDHAGEHRLDTPVGVVYLSVFENNHRPVFRLRFDEQRGASDARFVVETVRPDGSRQKFPMANRGGFLESAEQIPEPHAFTAHVQMPGFDQAVVFKEDETHGAAHRDNNMRAAIVHVLADAAVSVLVIAGLVLARVFGWLWMDPLAGMVGAFVILSWSYALVRDTGAILLDMNPDRRVTDDVRRVIEADGDKLTDLHVWRLGPGHLGAVLSVATSTPRTPQFYRDRLAGFRSLSHVTIEVVQL